MQTRNAATIDRDPFKAWAVQMRPVARRVVHSRDLLAERESLCPTLPVLERLYEELGPVDPAVRGLFGLQHLFGSTASLITRLARQHMDPAEVHLLGKPYSANPRVVRFLRRNRGYWVHPDSTVQPEGRDNDGQMDARISATLERIRARIARFDPAERILLIDDGGRAIQALHTERFADIRDRFTCVEQTRCGTRALENLDLRIPVINVAESWVKLEHESPLIAESVNHELTLQLAVMAQAGLYRDNHALIIGFGSIGQAVARELRLCGRDVAVYDSDEDKRVAAVRAGFPVISDLHVALERGGAIIGCTGLPVLDHEDYDRIADGSLLISASSADVEFRAWQLRTVGLNLGRPESWNLEGARPATPATGDSDRKHPCFSLYRLDNGGRRFYLVNGGFPVNFSGGVDPIPAEKIQLTRSLLYLGALQASQTNEPGLHALSGDNQARLMELYTGAADRRAA